ncbi:FAD-binding oxidoreductase [Streptomyces sp. WMMB 322]|uniref:FAD-binding oxidoreductase n=1 Tax=Streptomyces sp. WMMB 322 TaxID=1286821 RepID=UPI0006E194EC|nr:FAD-binding oxidoreductase [Streptomyces sp. WMMB 322]SCK55015.1 FAD/FMN-containing dehydrogenase [Streptomyces sp. WMMB 322]
MPHEQTNASTAAAEQAIAGQLRDSLRGEVIDRGHPGYDEARAVWNGLIDRRPAVIARCRGTADVVGTVRAAREHRPVVSVRGGGHQVAGSAVCDDGLVIDLSRMRGVHVDPAARTARAQAGVTWGELDSETQLHGLAAPGGEISVTGIAGLTLGGGLGFVMRTFGLSCDSVRSLEVVTADGAVRTVSREEDPELFWAMRGGGRGMGVVTSFEFGLHRLGPQVAAALVLYPYEHAESVLRAWRDVTCTAPETVTPEILLWSVPPDPAIPEELHGAKCVIVGGVYGGPAGADADAALAPLRDLGPPLADLSGTVPYVALQSANDGLFPDGRRYFMKSHFTEELTDEAIRTLLEWDSRRPTPQSLVVVRTLGGAVARVGRDDSAFAHRSARYNVSVDSAWEDPALDDAAIGWARSAWDDMKRFSSGGTYVNFAGLGEDASELHGEVFGPHEERLERIRTAYDPEGLFARAARRP